MSDPTEPMDDGDRLYPCANCGSDGEYQQQSDGGRFIECTNPMCGMSTCLMYACGEDPMHILMEKWNRRSRRSSEAVPVPLLREALEETWRVIDSAGLLNLSNGVQLGPTVWYVKANDARELSMAALNATKEHGK